MKNYGIIPINQLLPTRFETLPIYRQLTAASRVLAELKGIAGTIPNQEILLNTLSLQEAKDSSAIENIITTHDDIFREDVDSENNGNQASKEVLRYRQALQKGFEGVKKNGLISTNQIIQIQRELECNNAGLRTVPGTTLKDSTGRIIYTPPQSAIEIKELMSELEFLINEDSLLLVDPLIKMAIIHHRFESIHPFYDGNGRTGRILNVLYLVKSGLLDIPVLYLSRYIVQNKSRYYELLQSVRTHNTWEEWILYMLEAVEATALQSIHTIKEIKNALQVYKHQIRLKHKFYSQDLINNLFHHPYTKIDFVMNDLKVTRLTATRYLEKLVETGFLNKHKLGRNNYYVNIALYNILTENYEFRNPES